MQDLDGRTAVITGGAGAIGLAMARVLASHGMQIVLADVEQAALDAAADDLTAAGAEVLAVVSDVSDAASVEALADRAEQRFGHVHVVCNNAGVAVSGNIKDHNYPDAHMMIYDLQRNEDTQ